MEAEAEAEAGAEAEAVDGRLKEAEAKEKLTAVPSLAIAVLFKQVTQRNRGTYIHMNLEFSHIVN